MYYPKGSAMDTSLAAFLPKPERSQDTLEWCSLPSLKDADVENGHATAVAMRTP